MSKISSKSGSIGYGEASWDNGDTKLSSSNYSIIKKANFTPLPLIFKYYKISGLDNSDKISCPFPDHNERSPSFKYYSTTNTFWCFGCSRGNRACDFVMNMENISCSDAAAKILDITSNDYIEEYIDDTASRQDLFKIKIEFCKFIQDCISDYNPNLEKIENICKVYDNLNNKYNLNYDALTSIITKLTHEIKKI